MASLAGTMSDSDEAANCAEEIYLKEEEKLRAGREKEAERQKAVLKDVFTGQAALDQGRFSRLDELLKHANMYTEFLNENLRDQDKAQDEEQENASHPDTAAQSGTKRKAGRPARAPAKRSKQHDPQREEFEGQSLLQASLRDYQVKGIRWLISLYRNGISGILADQMGLGKTVQTIGLLAHLRRQKVYGPFIIIAPLSTLSNWVSEFERWCPEIKALLYHGSKAERETLRRKRLPAAGAFWESDAPVVVTSYEIVMADAKFMAKYGWKYIIVDEGHRLKNHNSKLLRELRTLDTTNKLLLTGTPLQNNLSELWSLLNFILPEIFNSMEAFQSWFDFSQMEDAKGREAILAQEQQSKVVSKLHGLLRPFLLRRIKADVEGSLPPKQEIIMWAPMSKLQHELNTHLRDNTLHDAMGEMSKKAGGHKTSTVKLNNVLMQMRKNCCHPDLITSASDGSIVYPSAEEMVEQCGKLELLDRLLVQLHAGGHKVLIFSQMTKLLDLLDSFLEQKGHKACRIDGSVSWQERQAAMKSFNTDPGVFCFLLSTRAGGLGINLTAADSVIIYDSDWNPHQDMQAMDRAHRIGQTRPVLVLRLATAHSVEGRLLRRANSKLALERLVIKRGQFLPEPSSDAGEATGMTQQELLELLRNDSASNDEPQSGTVTDKMLKTLLNRDYMSRGKPAPFAPSGVGYELIRPIDGAGMLTSVE